MSSPPLTRLLSLAAAMALVLSACGSDDDSGDSSDDSGGGEASGAFIDPAVDCAADWDGTTGIDGDTIKIGTVRPASGPYAIYDTVTSGVDAYFKAVNADGGVQAGDGNTYQIELVKGDDKYEPANTPGVVKQLVEQDQVFGMVGQIGTANNLAVRDYMNDNCVPSVSLATGSPQWGLADEYPWFIGGLPSYATEAHRFMDWLSEENPSATVAVLYQDDDFGKAYKDTLEAEAEGTDIEIVAEESFNPLAEQSAESKVAALAQSDADVFFVGIGGTPCPQSLTFIPDSWTPLTYASVTCASATAMSLAGDDADGVYSVQATLDPGGANDQENPKIVEFMEKAAAAGLDEGTIKGGIAAPGWNMAAVFVRGVENAEEVTRDGVMNALFAFEDEDIGLMRDDVLVNTANGDDPWPIEGLAMVQRDVAKGEWVEVDPVIDYNGESNAIAGI